ncbi:hypothetical protein BC936DRAFT_136592 [Jimgerdemannia flammicorona]|uniref:Ras-associating domain-containing protein n=1 Tax=Jimgerdemannia flammicorona TaxID=994334 RepID=A0A433DJG1_9FUNG|nr:hypothetical protein BC936DRAFT_136592 [Jimgerdemannia flammicorona]
MIPLIGFRKTELRISERSSRRFRTEHLLHEVSRLSIEVTRLREEMMPLWKGLKDNKATEHKNTFSGPRWPSPFPPSKPLPVPDPQLSPLGGSYSGRNQSISGGPGQSRTPGFLQPSNARSPTTQGPRDEYQNMPVSPHSPGEPGSNRSAKLFDGIPSYEDVSWDTFFLVGFVGDGDGIQAFCENDYIEHRTHNVNINDGGAIKVYGEKISGSSKIEVESPKSFRVSLDDPCYKVLPHALKKYKITDDWRLYQLWIRYGPEGDTQERALGYDEKPLRIFQKLKEGNQNPFFMMKHIKESKSVTPLGEHYPSNSLFRNTSKSNLSLQKDLPPSPVEKYSFGSSGNGTISLSLARDPSPPPLASSPTPTSAFAPYGQFPSYQLSNSVDSQPTRSSSKKPENFLGDIPGLESGLADAISSYLMDVLPPEKEEKKEREKKDDIPPPEKREDKKVVKDKKTKKEVEQDEKKEKKEREERKDRRDKRDKKEREKDDKDKRDKKEREKDDKDKRDKKEKEENNEHINGGVE